MDDSIEWSTRFHNAHRALWPLVAIAATLTAFQEQGFAMRLGATAAWTLALLTMGMTGQHRWDTCSHCDQPPPAEATPEARSALAHRVHRRGAHHFLRRWILKGVVIAAVLPKPYLEPLGDWRPAVLAPLYLLLAAGIGRSVLRTGAHKVHHADCHVEWCRAGQRLVPLQRWKHEVGHHALWVLLLLIPAVGVLGIAALDHARFEVPYALGVLAVLQGLLVHARYHSEVPCMVCARRMPTNGGKSAERPTGKRLLRTWHLTRFFVPLLAAGSWVLSWMFPHAWPGRSLLFASAVLLVAWLVVSRFHSRLQPWCPWCRDDNGGEEAVDSVPDPSRGQPLPA